MTDQSGHRKRLQDWRRPTRTTREFTGLPMLRLPITLDTPQIGKEEINTDRVSAGKARL